MSEVRTRLVYAGTDDGFKDDKLRYVYYEILEEGETISLAETPFYFRKKLVSRQGRPGVIIACDKKASEDNPGNFTVSNYEVLGRWHDREWILAQQARDEAVREARSKIRQRYEDEVRKHLAPLKAIYARLSPKQKRAMIAMIIEFLGRLSDR